MGVSQDKDKERLNKFIYSEVKALQKQILDLCEVTVPPSNWNPFRKKILDITNNVRREIQSEVVSNYIIDYKPSTVCEDIIQIKPSNTVTRFKKKDKEILKEKDNGN